MDLWLSPPSEEVQERQGRPGCSWAPLAQTLVHGKRASAGEEESVRRDMMRGTKKASVR